MERLLLTVIMFLFFGAAIASAEATTEIKIDLEIQQYSWYKSVSNAEKKDNNDYVVRFAVAEYLEDLGLYKASDTSDCSKNTKRTCYIGNQIQDEELLKALREDKKVQLALSKATPGQIVNGVEEKVIKRKRLFLALVDIACQYMDKKSCEDLPDMEKYVLQCEALK